MDNTGNYYHVFRLDKTSTSLQEELKSYCRIDINKCMECGKCSGGCSNADIFDITPRKIVQLVKYGNENKLLEMDALWTCVGCHLCVDRCPSSINIPRIIDYFREKSYKMGLSPTRPNVLLFNELMLGSVKKKGRVAEVMVTVKFNIKSGQLTKDSDMGMKMFFKGKLSPFSPKIKKVEEVRRLFRDVPLRMEG